MDLLRSSILGKEFINYRKHTSEIERKRFYKITVSEGKIPVVIDSVDEQFEEIIRKKYFINNCRIIRYGLELEMDENAEIEDVVKEIKIELLKHGKEYLFIENEIRIGLEDGSIIDNKREKIKEVYKKYKNEKDNILYLLITQEKTIYNYIMSILRNIWKIWYKE